MKAQRKLILAVLTVALAVATVPGAALAGGTRAGTDIDNTALVSWNAGSVGYTTSDSVTFVVDELINIQVTNNGAVALSVWPGETFRPLAFDVVNAGNSTIDLEIQAGGDGSLFVSNVNIWNEVATAGFSTTDDNDNGAGPFTVATIGVDTVYTYYIVADVGASPITTNSPDAYDLIVTAWDLGVPGAIGADNAVAFNGTTVEQIMADTGGTATGFADFDGRDSAQATYNLSWAGLTLTKSFAVIDSDPLNSGQHAIPGATVRYTLHVLNSGNAAATGVSITDATPAGTIWGAVQAGYPTTGSVNAGDPVIWSIPSLAGGGSGDLVFDVTITGP
jgi:uncharacterized repeat protein (TIGR01451 family)